MFQQMKRKISSKVQKKNISTWTKLKTSYNSKQGNCIAWMFSSQATQDESSKEGVDPTFFEGC